MTDLEHSTMVLAVPITVRPAQQADIPRLEWYGQYAHFRTLFQRAYAEQKQGQRMILIADCQGFPIGHIFIQLHSKNTLIAEKDQRAYLYSFRVMEMFQRMGVGTRLILEAERLLHEHGYNTVTIAVSKTNHAARRLYERLGYKIFAQDSGQWSYIDHTGQARHINDPCWLLEKNLSVR